jgi:hypothetical protein
MSDSAILLTLQRLESEFGADITEAQGLTGQELLAVCERIEDEVMQRQLDERPSAL